jgi:hypothetical protein
MSALPIDERLEADVRAAAKARGAEVIVRPHGHFQIKGRLLVNYYPGNKNRTAYVAGTTSGKKDVSPTEAVAMAFNAPAVIHDRDLISNRSGKTRKVRASIMRRLGNKCHWCEAELTLDNSTIEHVIPLKRGGLDNSNNRVLACHGCNHGRGHDMPELKK